MVSTRTVAAGLLTTLALALPPAALAQGRLSQAGVQRDFDLPTIFDRHGQPSHARQSVFTFQLVPNGEFTVRLGNVSVDMRNGTAWIKTGQREAASLRATADASYGIVLISTQLYGEVAAQLVLLDRSRRFIGATPIVTQPMRGAWTAKLSVRTIRVPFPNYSFVSGSRADQMTTRRATHCWSVPVLAGLEYATDRCPSPGEDRLYRTPSEPAQPLAHVLGGGMSRWPAAPVVLQDANVVAGLDKLVDGKLNPVALHAAARTCKQPLHETAVTYRKPRARGNDSCEVATYDMVVAYQAAYGPERWNIQDFDTIVTDIAFQRPPRIAARNPSQARRFAETVATSSALGPLKAYTAFSEANARFGMAAYGTLDLEAVAMRQSAGGPAASLPDPASVASQTLGIYALELRTRQAPAPVPRMRFNGQWIDAQDGFDIQLSRDVDGASTAAIRRLMRDWQATYRSAMAAAASEPQRQLLEQGHARALAMGASLAPAPDRSNALLTVSWRGEILAVISGRVNGQVATIDHVVSAPSTLTLPFAEGMASGASAAAIHAFLEMARSNGAYRAMVHTVTPRSAQPGVAGFRLMD
ncbi:MULTISPECIES: hypothetical protein [unclassified Cupriavidus]|uniref:hypothetical protein n=1 Tax=unclassified Cupriavidus TaxID=2640874 RepID=UPI001C001BD0|nr:MULTISPECIES: hypothetical protein [unclassified Cupriavidus]MCA3192876.1 hypothetical protein [Cupriavidus sp.]MCA3195077.1 hypothetical protein [Cupriavidus sp.]MCA3204047.1 hypothetical protein [Cupriavidus sp.]MCA3208713.1 hypothetical protein [Cupriavidus sp.]QWE93881.1 hypothetical protein KLP38_13335 [Cupriavidus sp. EM10]